MVTRVGTIKAQRLNMIMISQYYNVHDNLSAGGLRRRILQAFPPAAGAPAAPPADWFVVAKALTKTIMYYIIESGRVLRLKAE
jgi:hypothetical protein